VTVLSDLDEKVPWGHELGIGVAQLAFAYVGAYIFNWLIVERPRAKAKALEGYYRAAWNDLTSMASTPAGMVMVLAMLAGSAEMPKHGASKEQLLRILSRGPWTSPQEHTGITSALRQSMATDAALYSRLLPLLGQFDPSVSVAIAAMNPAALNNWLNIAASAPSMLAGKAMQGLIAQGVAEHQEAGRRLANALAEAKHAPRLDAEEYARLQYPGLGSP
jgi:hypothetical protein